MKNMVANLIELEDAYAKYYFLVSNICDLSRGTSDPKIFMESADKAMAQRNIRAMRLGLKSMMDWALHLDEPHRSQILRDFQMKFEKKDA